MQQEKMFEILSPYKIEICSTCNISLPSPCNSFLQIIKNSYNVIFLQNNNFKKKREKKRVRASINRAHQLMMKVILATIKLVTFDSQLLPSNANDQFTCPKKFTPMSGSREWKSFGDKINLLIYKQTRLSDQSKKGDHEK